MKNFETGRDTPYRHSEPFMGEESMDPSGLCPLRMTGCSESRHSTPLLSSLGKRSATRGSTWHGLNASHYAQYAQCGHISFLRHAELVSASQAGRSMVETLGVLAIMGIISIGGLYGYTNAMKRHRANELINEANKRAVVVAGQLLMNKPLPEQPNDTMLGEFTDPDGYSFKVGKNPQNTKQFNIEVDGVSEEVCEQLKVMMAGVVRGVECSEGEPQKAILTFNKDMSATPHASDYTYANCPGNFYKCPTTETCVTSAQECLVEQNLCSSYPGTAPAGTIKAGVTYSGGLAGTGTDDTTSCKCPTGQRWDNTLSSPACIVGCDGFIAGNTGGVFDDGLDDPREECIPCSEIANGFGASPSECARCGKERVSGSYQGYFYFCYLATCPEGTFPCDWANGCCDCSFEEETYTPISLCESHCNGSRTAYTDSYGNEMCAPAQ